MMSSQAEEKPRKGKASLWLMLAFLAVLVVALLGVLTRPWQQQLPAPSADALQSLSGQGLQDEKVRQEILNLELENRQLTSSWQLVPPYASFVTALVAVIGALVTIWRQVSEGNRQKELDRHQRALDREQREAESLRRFDEKFTSTITSLGSESPAVQAGAAVSLITFLKPEYVVFHEQVYMTLLANLRIEHATVINKLLVEAFEKSLRIQLEYASEAGEDLKVNLARTHLSYVDLSGLDLTEVDLGFADLHGANLTGSVLRRARGIEVNLAKARLSRADLNEARFRRGVFSQAQLHEANLVAADLKEADLSGAQFHRASLQSAHLENARLEGARFEQANLNDTFLRGATLDLTAMKSIVNALNWQKANVDEAVRTELEKLAGDGK